MLVYLLTSAKGCSWGNDVKLPVYTVRFASEGAFRKAFERDITKEGLFIISRKLPQVNQTVKLKIYPPGLKDPIVLYGRVVRVVSIEEAERSGEKVGFAVHLENMSDELKSELWRISRGWHKGKFTIHGRRRSPRKKVDLEVDVLYRDNVFRGKVTEISLYGAYVAVKGLMVEEGETLRIVFKGGITFAGKSVDARVVYFLPMDKALKYGKSEGMGVEFEHLDDELYLAIYSLFE